MCKCFRFRQHIHQSVAFFFACLLACKQVLCCYFFLHASRMRKRGSESERKHHHSLFLSNTLIVGLWTVVSFGVSLRMCIQCKHYTKNQKILLLGFSSLFHFIASLFRCWFRFSMRKLLISIGYVNEQQEIDINMPMA